MSRFVAEIALFLVLQIPLGAFFLWPRAADEQASLASTVDKRARLLNAEGPRRIVFVGGSSVSFGVRCASLVAAMPDRDCVNMGNSGRAGLEFVLNEALSGLRNGDAAVLQIEYQNFIATPGAPTWDILGFEVRAWRYVPWYYAAGLADTALSYGGVRARRSLYALLGRDEKAALPYRRHAFNAYGDMDGHEKLPRLPERIANLIARYGLPEITDSTVDDAAAILARFRAAAEAKGAKVAFLFPALPREISVHPRAEERIAQIQSVVRDELKFHLLSAPEEERLPTSEFFDTEYHMTFPAREQRMARLIPRIAAWWGP